MMNIKKGNNKQLTIKEYYNEKFTYFCIFGYYVSG